MKQTYYQIQHSGVTTHFQSLAAAKRVAQIWANKTGLTIRVNKMNHKKYHHTGSPYVQEAAILHPKVGNPRRNPLPIGKLTRVRVKRLRNGRIEIYGA